MAESNLTTAELAQVEAAKAALGKATKEPLYLEKTRIEKVGIRSKHGFICFMCHPMAYPGQAKRYKEEIGELEANAEIFAAAPVLVERVVELEAEVAALKEWQEKVVPWLVDAKEFTDSSISKCPQIIQMADDRQRKMIADLPNLIAQAQEGEKA